MSICPQTVHALIDLSPLPSQLTTLENQLDRILSFSLEQLTHDYQTFR